jgi:hypothetical protein
MSEDKQEGRTARAIKLPPARMRLAEFVRSVHAITPEVGVTREDFKRPDFWGNVSNMLKPNDRIEVVAQDGEFFAEFLVVSCGKQFAKVVELRYVELAEHMPEDNEERFDVNSLAAGDYEIKYGNNEDKFRVIRKSDKEILHKGSATKAEAGKWLDEYLVAMEK